MLERRLPPRQAFRDVLLSATKNRRTFSKIVAENEVKQCVGLEHTKEREGPMSEWPSVTKLTNDGGRGECCQILNVA